MFSYDGGFVYSKRKQSLLKRKVSNETLFALLR